MNIQLGKRGQLRRFALFIGVFAALITSAGIANYTLAQGTEPTPSAEGRLVSIHDRGEERIIVTKARTLRQALEAAQVDIAVGHDVVEPSLDTELVASKYNVNIYRARPVTVVDGLQRQKVTTAEQTTEGIARAAGVTLYKEDNVTIDTSRELLRDGAGMVMNVDRALPVFLTLYGAKTEVRTQEVTVGDLLKSLNVTIGASDFLSVPVSDVITSGMSIELWREGKQTVTVDEEVPYTTEKINDANREMGYREVQSAGENGSRSVTYEIEMKNGEEVARTEIASVTTKEPKKQVEIVGAKAKPVTGTCGEWMTAAGVPSSSSATYLIGRESGCNPNSVNRSSGACGIGQALPCSKMGPVNSDGTSSLSPVDQMRWMNNYVLNRYGSWEAAASHHQARGWY